MKFSIIIFTVLLFRFHCVGQSYFNNLYSPNNSLPGVGKSIYAESSKISIAAATFTNDTIGWLLTNTFLQLDFNGNLIDTHFYSLPLAHTYTGGAGSLYKIADGFILSGSQKDSMGADALLMKINSNGNLIWTKLFGDSKFQIAWMGRQDNYKNILLCGQTNSYDPFGDMLLIKTDSLGDTLWTKHYGDTLNRELAYSFCITPEGGYLLAGRKTTPLDVFDMYLVKIDSLGNIEWDKILGGDSDDEIWNITMTTDGNAVFCGYKGYDNSHFERPYVAKINLSGNLIWEKEFEDTANHSKFVSVRELSDGSLILAGTRDSYDSINQRGNIYKLSANGDSLWSHRYYNLPFSRNLLNDIYPTFDGGFVATGYVIPHLPDTGNQDIWVLKIDSMGCEVANCTIGIDDMINKYRSVNVYPDPFINNFTIETEKSKALLLKIYNFYGQTVYSKFIFDKSNVINDFSALPGMYFISLTEKDKIIYSGKIIHTE